MWLLTKYIDRRVKEQVDIKYNDLLERVDIASVVADTAERLIKHNHMIQSRIRFSINEIITSQINNGYSTMINKEEFIDSVVERIKRKQLK